VRLFAHSQIGMVSQAELVLRLGRAVTMRLLEANAAAFGGPSAGGAGTAVGAGTAGSAGTAMRAVGGIMGSELVDGRGLVERS
jgi:hypothetical protein